ncbi:hypothetical protein [Sneathiella sp. HT1-7]|uniref:hypothetical protein n=1 Tax=Sneathiella sp. HT1-7 TaxID=2887192 RepID=UPI001D14FC95|nr:hypothetical protein [Sneathiella sp. HT1-7]MCC3305492.1 hypothetical protein [Sneathiella sp. HT1-7]
MKWRKIASASFTNIKYETKECCGQYLHVVTQSGSLDREDRAPVYEETLALTKTSNYFCILDNRKAKESLLSMADMSGIGDMLISRGIKRFIYAVVTKDPAYDKIIRLIKAISMTKNLEVEAISTADFATAEKFILMYMNEYAKAE